MTHPKNPFQHYAFVAVGANLASSFGSPQESIAFATDLVAELSDEPLLISTLLETQPVDCPPNSPVFVNGMLGLIPKKSETALSLLHRLQQIENTIGRTRSGLINEARVLDLDLITFKEEECDSEELTLPHPRATIRAFVLEPLAELVGDIVFVGQSLSVNALLEKIKA